MRGLLAHGTTDDVTAEVAGAGVDLGWSWVVGEHAAIQLGGGVAWARVVARPRPGAFPPEVALLDPAQRRLLEGATVSAGFVLPVATTGLGVAF